MRKEIRIGLLVIFMQLLLIFAFNACKKEPVEDINTIEISQLPPPPPPTSAAFSQNYCGDTTFMGGFITESVVEIDWGGIHYYQGRIVPDPTVTPYRTDRRPCPDKFCGWMIMVDTVEIVEGQRFTLIRN